MARIQIKITLDNIPSDIDGNDIANQIEGLVEEFTNMDVSTEVYDTDGVNTSNPLMMNQLMKRVERG